MKTSRRVVYRGKILDLYVDRVRVPDGSRHLREVVGHTPAVAVVPLLADGRVLLVRQFRYAIGKKLLEIPAGLLAAREQPRQAALRELREETGYHAGSLQLLASFYSSPGYCREKIDLFLARHLKRTGSLSLDRDEFLEVLALPFTQALRLLEKGKIIDGKSVVGLLLAAHRMKKY
ncbi:NUDIX hydrolase [candidate division FCPU426 bacterium]|nr:NUDIX hydrolase [candidate division FCPU426 bacterium]